MHVLAQLVLFRNVVTEGHAVGVFTDDRWNRPIVAGDIVPAVVVSAPKTGAARLRVGRYQVDLARESFAWTRRASPADLFKPGDLVDVRVTKIDDAAGTATVSLEQTPVAEARAGRD